MFKIGQLVTVNSNLKNSYPWERFLDHTKLDECQVTNIFGNSIQISSKHAPELNIEIDQKDIRKKLINLIIGQKTFIYNTSNIKNPSILQNDQVTIIKVIDNPEDSNDPKVLFETENEERFWGINSIFDKNI